MSPSHAIGTSEPDGSLPFARAWRTVLEHIEAELLDGTRGPGDRLPAERELAATLGVGRSSVREALRVLEVMGLIRTGTGSGPSSGAIIVTTPRGGMAALLRLQVAAHGFPLDDVVSTRLLLESAIVTDVADNPDRETGDVHSVMDAMDATSLSPADFLALDARLHLALAEASGNTVVTAIMAGLRTSIEAYVRAGAARLSDWDGTAARLRREHRALVAAVDAGNATLARDLVRAHISGYYTEISIDRVDVSNSANCST